MKCCNSKKCCSKDNVALLVVIGIIVLTLKVFALIDLFKKRKSYSKGKKILLTLFILIFPPAPIIYLIVVNITNRDDENESVNLNREGLL